MVARHLENRAPKSGGAAGRQLSDERAGKGEWRKVPGAGGEGGTGTPREVVSREPPGYKKRAQSRRCGRPGGVWRSIGAAGGFS